jgi:hypothetical protein
MDDAQPQSMPPAIQRLNSYASSSSSSGVVANFHSKSLSQNLSCDSSRSNFSTFESLDLNLSDCSDLAGSLPSCATNGVSGGTGSSGGVGADYNGKDEGTINLCTASSFVWNNKFYSFVFF